MSPIIEYEIDESRALDDIQEMCYKVNSWEKLPQNEWPTEWRANWKNRENVD